MVRVKVDSIKKFWEKYGDNVDKGVCIVSDIDNVWFDGVLNIRTWVSRFEVWKLRLMEEISQKSNLLLFTNRGFWGTWKGGYVDQLEEFFGKTGIEVYHSSKGFEQVENFSGMGLVQNAMKPSRYSINSIKHLLERYKKVIYVSSRDFPFIYKDLDLVNLIEERLEPDLLKKFVFVDIDDRR